jgi:hypothetical protein
MRFLIYLGRISKTSRWENYKNGDYAMNTLKSLLALTALSIGALSCSAVIEEPAAAALTAQARSFTLGDMNGKAIQMEEATFFQSHHGPEFRYLRGTVVVENIAYEKNIQIVYSDDNWDSVHTHPAEWVGKVEGTDLDRFRFQTYAFINASVEFAFSYEVAGQTYWDNNGGANYTLSTAQGVFGDPEVQLLDAEVVYNEYTEDYSLYGKVVAKRAAGVVSPVLHFSVDGGAWETAVCLYGYTTYKDDYNLYQFNVNLGDMRTVEFALEFDSADIDDWDNQHYFNYSLNNLTYDYIKVSF